MRYRIHMKSDSDQASKVVSFRTKVTGAHWLETESKRRGIPKGELCREIFKLGVDVYKDRRAE